MLWPPAISEPSQHPVPGTSEAGAPWPWGAELLLQIQNTNSGTPAQGSILRPFLRGWVGIVAVHAMVALPAGLTCRWEGSSLGRVVCAAQGCCPLHLGDISCVSNRDTNQ